jgi:hypothetical protein
MIGSLTGENTEIWRGSMGVCGEARTDCGWMALVSLTSYDFYLHLSFIIELTL